MTFALFLPPLGLLLVFGAVRLAALPALAGQGGNLALLLVALVVCFLAALWLARRASAAGAMPGTTTGFLAGAALSLPALLAVGLLIRIPLVAAPPRLSDDIYRYVWDGRVAAAGVNPYRHAPTDTALATLRDADWALINNPGLPTIYPPAAQGVFRAGATLAPGVAGLKSLFLLFDLGVALLLAGTAARAAADRWRLVLYWWHPLPAIEWCWSGHADVVGLFCLTAAFVVAGGARAVGLRRVGAAAAAGALAALAALVKFLALPALPFLAPRRRWTVLAAFAGATALLYVPFLEGDVNVLGSLGTYAAKWRSNDVFFGALVRPGTALDLDARLTEAKLFAAAAAGAVLVLALLIRASRAGAIATVLGTAVLLSPTVHPWYLAWIVPFLAFRFSGAWLYATIAVLLAYHPIPSYLAGDGWRESTALKVGAALPFLGLGAWELLRRVRRPASAPREAHPAGDR
jgi:alpha-1,6-mannosyltransferase